MKRTLSFILALVLLIGLMPMQAFATEVSYDQLSTVWPSINTDLTHIICYGQSFSTGSDAPYYDDPTVDNVYVYGSITNSSKGTELKHLTASAGNQHPIISAGNVFAKLLNAAGINTDIILGSYGSGGKTIAQLMSDERQAEIKEEEGYTYDILSSGRYEIFQGSVSALAQYAEKNEQSIGCPAIVYLQGETDQNTDAQLGYPENPARAGYGAGGDKEKYKEYMSRLKEDMQREVMEQYGQTEKPLFIIYQVSGTYTRTQYSSINMAQIEFAQENEDVILVQSPYFASHYTNSHHLTQNGYRWLGEYIGRSMYTALVEREKPWPMLPKSIEVTGKNTVRITVKGAQNGLTIDTWTVENASNSKNLYGFYLQSDGKIIVPTAVSVHENVIELTLPANLASETVYVYYAGKHASGTGNICDNCAELGFYEYLDDSNDTGTGNNQDVSHSSLDANGNSIIGQKYPMYNWLSAFCYEVEVPEPEQRQAAYYHWEMQESGLVSVTEGNATENNLTLVQGSVVDGVLNKVQYTMAQEIVLEHDRPWVIEWKAAGNGNGYYGGKFLNSTSSDSHVQYLYIPADSRGMVAWGVSSDSANYGFQLNKMGIDYRKEHTYRIENRIADDGVNTVYLIVDGVEIGAMTTGYRTSANTSGSAGSMIEEPKNWANGKDLFVSGIGASGSFLLNNMKLSYLKVWENGQHTHSYTPTVTTPTCTEQGYTTHACACGDSYVDSYTAAKGHSYTATVITPTCAEDGYTNHTCPCGDSYKDSIVAARGYEWMLEDGEFKLLLIGNSFSEDASNFYSGKNSQLLDILQAMLGAEVKVTVGLCYSGGKGLNWHATQSELGNSSYTLRIISTENGKWKSYGSYTSANALTWTDWDVVTLQHYEINTTTGEESNAYPNQVDPKFQKLEAATEFMLDYVDRYAPNAAVYFYMHWARAYNPRLNESLATYKKMAEFFPVVLDYAGTESANRFETIIPVGFSIQNARTTYLAKLAYNTTAYADGTLNLTTDAQIGLQRDGGHLSYNVGRYIAALTFAEMIIPEQLRAEGYVLPEIRITESVGKLPQEYTEIAQKAVFAAVNSWKNGKLGEVSTIEGYTEDPTVAAGQMLSGAMLQIYCGADVERLKAAVLVLLPADFAVDSVVITAGAAAKLGDSFSCEVTIRYGYTSLKVTVNGKVVDHAHVVAVTAPTCTEQGYTTHTCPCGDSYVDSYTEKTAHSYGAWQQVKAPACDAEGQDKRVCSACGDTQLRDTRITGDPNKIMVSTPRSESDFAGKTLLLLGDSITCGVGVTDPQTQVYGALVGTRFGMKVINKAISGSGYCTGGKMTTNNTLTEENVAKADIITIMLGINDFNWAVKDGYWNGKPNYYDATLSYCQLGEFGSDDTSTVYGALKSWCEKIVAMRQKAEFADKQFVFITPPIASWNASMGGVRNWDQDKLNVHGHTLRQYCTAIMEVCAYYEIPVFDANMFSGIYYKSAEDNNIAETGGDGVHINAAGHALLADALAEFLLEGYTYENRTVADGGHHYEETMIAPSCLEMGYTVYRCSECHYSYVDDYVTENGHSFVNVQHVTAPTADALGLDKHTCSVCGVVETFEVEGAWQKYNLADHLQQLPADFCSGTNLWELLEPEVLMLDQHGNWVDVSGPVYSVTIPVRAGDRVFANSFVERGIQVSFIGEYGILKTYFSGDTKRAYQADGCLIAPEGTIAVNVPVWDVNDADNCLRILNYDHSYDTFTVAPTCTEDGYSKNGCRTCEEGTVLDVVKASGHMVTFLPGREATCTTDGITEGSFCSVCNQVLMEQEIIPAGHTIEVMDSVIPGVAHTGLTAGLHCTGCGTVYVPQKEIPVVNSLEDYLYGKYVSVLGDSISTYEGVCNDPESNNHTVNNVAGYHDGGYYKNDDILSVDQTWWMQSINHFSMRLLVNHASGSGTLLTKVSNGTLPAYYDEKCVNLHDNTGDNAGTLPEIIAVYIGVNDGSRKQIPGSVDQIDFENLIQKNSENGYVYATPTTMAEGYAVMLHKMQVAYPDAEIFLFTIPRTNDPVPAYADTIKDVANYFDVRVVDLYNSVLTQTGYGKYFHDGVHPNAAGMEIVSEIFNAELLELAMEYHLADGHKFDEGICEICGEAQPGPTITQQPESVGQEIGKNFAITVTAEGEGLTYQWYYRNVGSEVWNLCDAQGNTLEGVMAAEWDGREVYCVVTDCDGNSVTTDTVRIHTHMCSAIVTAPTCTEQGYTVYICACGYSYVDDYVDAIGHVEATDTAVAPTCTGSGLTEGKHCSLCGVVLVAQKEIAPTGEHEYTAGCCKHCGKQEVTHNPGDINGDGKLNNKDATRLFQYLAGWDVEVNEAALDINGDGKVNNKDATRLFQYLAGWDVEIHWLQ